MAQQSCYDKSGAVKNGWQPCNPKDSVSSCCGGTDLCMSNGLCLNAGGNQAYTIQGCTSKDWSAPCNFFCEIDDPNDTSGMYYLQYCWDTDPASETATQWCCGRDCCGDPSKVHNLTLAKQIYSPGKASAVATVTATTMLTLSSGATAPTGGTTSPTDIVNADIVSKQQYNNTVIGLSVPFAVLAFLAFGALLLWWLRALPPVVTRRQLETKAPHAETVDNNEDAFGAQVPSMTQASSSGTQPLHPVTSTNTGPKSPETTMSEMEVQNTHELAGTPQDSGQHEVDGRGYWAGHGRLAVGDTEPTMNSWGPGDEYAFSQSR